jgi:hypothetical protein
LRSRFSILALLLCTNVSLRFISRAARVGIRHYCCTMQRRNRSRAD